MNRDEGITPDVGLLNNQCSHTQVRIKRRGTTELVMQGKAEDLVGWFYLAFHEDGTVDQGWVVGALTADLYLVERYIHNGRELEPVRQVVHPIEMRGWLFFPDSAAAERYWDHLIVDGLDPIDLGPILKEAGAELVDLALEQIERARGQHRDERARELVRLLSKIAR